MSVGGDGKAQVELAEVHEMHNSERKSFRGCRLRWKWVFEDRWYPPLTPKPLEFGTAFHKAMEVYYDPETWDFPNDIKVASSVGAFVEMCEAQRNKYLAYLRSIGEPDSLSEEVKADYEERVELGKGMLRYFFAEVAPREDSAYKPLKVEIPFLVPIIHPDFMHDPDYDLTNDKWVSEHVLRCNSSLCKERHVPNAPVVFGGRIDILIEDHHGDYWIMDWKTAAVLSVERREAFLQTDDAIGAYTAALWKLGVKTEGFLYHEQRKAFPQPPPENKVQRLGCWYSKNKQNPIEYDSYLKTVQENDLHAYESGLYDDILRWLKEEGPKYYYRYQVYKTERQLEQIWEDLTYEAMDMTNPGLRIYPMAGRFSCESCAFRQPCIGRTAGEDYHYTLDTLFERREHYWVREEASTETKGGE